VTGDASHRIPLCHGWTIWRELELRSAGFPAGWVNALADEILAREVDEANAVGSTFPSRRFELAQQAASRYLRVVAGDDAFREAVTWQNRRVIHTGIAPLLRQADGATSSKVRQYERLVASYVQRYCCKNERIGFFGASAPARFVDRGPALAVKPGPGLIARRTTQLEPWAIDALADHLASDPELRPALAPRRMPTVRLDGTTLFHWVDPPAELPPAYAALLAACDGETAASAIAAQLVATPDLELGSVEEVYELLDELVANRLVIWTLEVPTVGGRPEALLRSALARLAPSPTRARGLAALATLEQARDGVAAATGSARLETAIAELEQTFAAMTEHASTRNPGEAYAGRTIVVEDCERDVELALGPPVIDRLAGPLELVLQGARWFTYEIARRYRVAIAGLYRELRGEGPAAVDYPRFHARLSELFPAGDAESIVPQVRGELHARWRQVLEVTAGDRSVERAARDLRPEVSRVFAAPHPGWPAARHHSPDVLVAAAGLEAANRGELLAVLGEVHIGMNALLIPEVPNAHGDPDAHVALRDRDVPGPSIAPVWSRRRSRLDYYSRSPRDLDLELGTARSWRPRASVLAIAELVLDEVDGKLVVRTRDGRVTFDVIAFLEHYLLAASFSEFGILTGEHTPRVVVDGVVLSRERWQFAATQLVFARAADPALRFAGARAFARTAGLPRCVFLKVPEETKPIFVDFASPTFVELAAKVMRKASVVSISEMLPDLDQLWLTDAAGERYTSELRIVAVDPVPWVPA
jgi:hypothetical protein